jgi:hypothetical protein
VRALVGRGNAEDESETRTWNRFEFLAERLLAGSPSRNMTGYAQGYDWFLDNRGRNCVLGGLFPVDVPDFSPAVPDELFTHGRK